MKRDLMYARHDERTAKWDRRFLRMALVPASWSKDPSTKVGCIIVRPDLTIASMGYNGFPRGIEDAEERHRNREEKYRRIVHAEVNAILNAHERLDGYTLYNVPFPPCDKCSGLIIQAGIARVVTVYPTDEQEERWGTSLDNALDDLCEAGVSVTYYPREVIDA